MWLIDTTTLELHEIIEPEEAGIRYAILSHTWGTPQEEVSFKDFADLNQARLKPGFVKIEKTCEIARSQGIQYAWVDTCCIDKSSSAELSEAINSMFMWYRMSEICYVYLADLKDEPYDIDQWFTSPTEPRLHQGDPRSTKARDDHFLNSNFARCRWFSRGWTLQELIAPRKAVFYDSQWQRLASKHDITPILSLVTGIDLHVLLGARALSEVPIFTRMSWAAKRTTTRVEDTAYCLLGIFDISLPLIYGEGSKAFRRLQEEIIQKTEDISILAWSSHSLLEPKFRPRAFRSPTSPPMEYRGALAWALAEFTAPVTHRAGRSVLGQDKITPVARIEMRGPRGIVLHNACVIHRIPRSPGSRMSHGRDLLEIPCLNGYVYRYLSRCPTGFVLEGKTLSRMEIDLEPDDTSEDPVRLVEGVKDLREVISDITLLDMLSFKDMRELVKPVVELGVSMRTAQGSMDRYYNQSTPVWPLARWSDVDRCFAMNYGELSNNSEIKLVAVQHIHREIFHDLEKEVHELDVLVGIGSRGKGSSRLGFQEHQFFVTVLTRGSARISSGLYEDRVDGILENARMMKPLHWVDHLLFLQRLRLQKQEVEDRSFFVRKSDGSACEILLKVHVSQEEVCSTRSRFYVELDLDFPADW